MSNNEYKKLVIRLIKDNRVSEEEALILINNINNECKSDTHVIQTEKPLVTDNDELNKLLKDYGEYPQSPFVYKKEEKKCWVKIMLPKEKMLEKNCPNTQENIIHFHYQK